MKSGAADVRQSVEVHVGKARLKVGDLSYVKQGSREFTQFQYAPVWLQSAERFEVSPDLPLGPGYFSRKAPTRSDSVFPFAFADTAPDAWGRRVVNRAHARERKANPSLPALTELDYLLAVDDFSRVGALRLGDVPPPEAPGSTHPRTTPPLIDLQRMVDASRAVETQTETTADLRYLQGRGTSLGGMRPKCSLIDERGHLAIAKFPSIEDERSVTRGEILALRLAGEAGIDAAPARVLELHGSAVALIERFDRAADGGRIAYLSAASMLQASREEDRSYEELLAVIASKASDPRADMIELWRRLVFNLLITNVDDHLQNHGFLYEGDGHWRLAPAFDVNPFPDKNRESKTWLTARDGPITSVAMLLARADHFGLSQARALDVLRKVASVVGDWRTLAGSPTIGIAAKELSDFEPAFEHDQMIEAQALLARGPQRSRAGRRG